jgi:tRNA (guanine-N7-)-methyltransferase
VTATPIRADRPPVRTFHPRRGRLRTRRREALERLWPVYGVELTGEPITAVELFGRPLPLVLEIGSGMGEATAAMAAADPDRGYLAVEVHTPGVANLLALAEAGGLPNLRVAHGDALDLLRTRVPAGSLAAIHSFFPDPWPKIRHHKRRLFQPAHVALLRSRLAPGGELRIATDWPDYATAIRDALAAEPALVNPHGGWAPGPVSRPATKYERRAYAAGRPVFELRYHRR